MVDIGVRADGCRPAFLSARNTANTCGSIAGNLGPNTVGKIVEAHSRATMRFGWRDQSRLPERGATPRKAAELLPPPPTVIHALLSPHTSKRGNPFITFIVSKLTV